MEKDETNKDDNDGKDCENKQMKKIHDILTPAVPEQKILVSAVITISLLPLQDTGSFYPNHSPVATHSERVK